MGHRCRRFSSHYDEDSLYKAKYLYYATSQNIVVIFVKIQLYAELRIDEYGKCWCSNGQ